MGDMGWWLLIPRALFSGYQSLTGNAVGGGRASSSSGGRASNHAFPRRAQERGNVMGVVNCLAMGRLKLYRCDRVFVISALSYIHL
jgi:hypothetical protein